MTAEEIIGSTAIQRVTVVGGDAVAPGSLTGPLVDARPVWRDGLLTLFVTAVDDGSFPPRDEALPPARSRQLFA